MPSFYQELPAMLGSLTRIVESCTGAAWGRQQREPALRPQPLEDASLRPADAAGAVEAEEAEMAAAGGELQLGVRPEPQTLERLDRDERIIARGEDEGR